MEDGVSIALSASLLFSVGKSLAFIIRKHISDNTWVWTGFPYEISHQTQSLAWRLTKTEGGRCIYSSVLFQESHVFAANLCFTLREHTLVSLVEHTHSPFWWKWALAAFKSWDWTKGLPRESTSWNLCKPGCQVCKSSVLLGRSAPIAPHYVRT